MPSLYIDRKGTEIKISGDVLVCYERDQRIATIPLAPIERIYLKGDVKLQASLLAKLGEKNIGVICLSGRKNIPTLFISQPHNDAERRLAQYELSNNEAFCLAFAKKLITLKLITQKNWLRQAIERRADKKPLLTPKVEELEKLLAKIYTQPTLPSLRGIEGRAANVYFTALSLYLPPSLGFEGRNRRPPRDPFNAVMSFAYTLLHSEAVLIAYGAGLEPYIGFFHSLDYGRESLACDLIEPIRPLVDNWLLGCFRQNILREEHFSTTKEGCFLGKAGRIHFYQEYEKAIITWRKMLTETCYGLVRLLKVCKQDDSPQRRAGKLSFRDTTQYEANLKKYLEKYYFSQLHILSQHEFYF